MRYKLEIDNNLFDIEILTLNENPITAKVNGELFNVWLLEKEDLDSHAIIVSSNANKINKQRKHDPPVETNHIFNNQLYVFAPIPGIITSIDVEIGDFVETGCPLCVLEAMKMKNVIRSTRNGIIKHIYALPGAHVQDKDVLFEFNL